MLINQSNIKRFFEDNSEILSVSIIYLLFHSFFEKYITFCLVNTFLCYLIPSFLNDIVFIVLGSCIVVRIVISWNKNYFISNKMVFVSILLCLAIFYYRFISETWLFTPLHLIEWVKYVDLIFLYFISNIIIRCFYRKKSYSVIENKGFCFDNPIEKANEDELNRNTVVLKVIEAIKNTANKKSSFALGVSSEWGRGKTSFLNLIEKGMEEKERIIVHFNPWLNNDEKAIVKSFFDELGNSLKPYNRELSSELQIYSEILNNIGLSETSWLSKISSILFNSNEDLRRRYNAINKAILSSGLQIVIFIDDLDRLYEKEILEVLRLIRNSASFSNTVFIVAYDRNYLISALSKANAYHPDLYLEKIFQIEIALPAFERSVIIKKLRKSLYPRLKDEDKKELEDILGNCNQPYIFDGNHFNINLLESLRDINRFVNSFIISYEALKGESELLDLLNIELLRIKYLGVYNLLADDYKSYLTTKTDRYYTSNYLTLIKDDKNEINLEKYLKTNYQDVGIQENQILDVLKYVYGVFPDFGTFHTVKQKLKSITNPISIDRYFHYNLLISNLSEIEFSNFRQKSDEEFQTKIKEWVNKGLNYEVSNRLERIEYFSDIEDYERIIKAIFYYATLPNENRNLMYLGFNANNLIRKLDYEKVKNFYHNKDSFFAFVEQIFKNQKPPYEFISDFIFSIFEDISISDWNFILPMEDLITMKLEFFRSYTSSIDTIDIHLFRLYHYCSYKKRVSKGSGTYYTEEVPSLKAKELFIECAARMPRDFIKNIITINSPIINENSIYSLSKIIPNVWDSWDNFESFILSLDVETVLGLKEFKIFFSKCKDVNFKRYIEFDFNEIDLSDALLLN